MDWIVALVWAVSLIFQSGCHGDDSSVYTVLEGDLNVEMRVDLNASRHYSDASRSSLVARILNRINETLVWKSVQWPQVGQPINCSFTCGVIDRAGLYRLQLWAEDEDDHLLLYSTDLVARWPNIDIQVPTELMNYRADFVAKLEWARLKCYPLNNSSLSLRAQVIHCGYRNTTCSMQHQFNQIRASVAIDSTIWQTRDVDVRFGCDVLSHPGFYRVVIVSAGSPADVIGMSQAIHVTMNPEFQMQIRVKQALPCGRELHVFYRRPECSGRRDRIRLYGKLYSNVSASIDAPFRLHYITEKVINPSRNLIAFPCQLFDPPPPPYGSAPPVYDAYCFRYVNTAPNNAIIEISQTCIPTHNQSMFAEPQWGPWSDYSECTSHCGSGVRYRYRYCDNPPPQYRGSFCVGNPIESETCEKTPCPDDKTVSPLLTTSYENSMDCKCGCFRDLPDENSSFTLVSSDAACTSGPLFWVFQAPGKGKILLDLDYLRLDCHPDNVIEIREGQTVDSPLIAKWDKDSSHYQTIITATSSILVQLNFTGGHGPMECITGFIASLRTVPKQEIKKQSTYNKISSIGMPVLAILSFLGAVLSGAVFLVILYSKCGFNLRHPKRSVSRGSHSSIWSDITDQQRLLTVDSPCTSIEELPEEVVRRPKRLKVMKSLPSTPFMGKKQLMRRSVTSSATLYKVWDEIDSNMNKPHLEREKTVKELHPKEPEEIELTDMKNVGSHTKVINTDDVNLSRTTVSFSSISIPSHSRSHSDQDFEFDYYDLDVRNAGDVPDSFFRCLADNSTYWDQPMIVSIPQDINCNPAVTQETSDSAEIPYVDDA